MSIRDNAKALMTLLEKIPTEKLTNYSLKEAQLERFSPLAGIDYSRPVPKKSLSEIVASVTPYQKKAPEPLKEKLTEQAIMQQIKSLKSIQSNQYRDYYFVSDKLTKPYGNPTYYERLLNEINGESKESFITGMRTVIFGK